MIVLGSLFTNHFSSQKTRLNDLSHGIKIWTDLTSVLSHPRVWHTDRQTAFSSLDRVCIACSAVKNETGVTAIVDIIDI